MMPPAVSSNAWLFLAWASLGCAAIPSLLFLVNVGFFRSPKRRTSAALEAVSVLVPARNEERSIRTVIDSVLAGEGIEFELIVLDDSSTDRTAEYVLAASLADSRVRLVAAPPLPSGWNGKQHACWMLAQQARHNVFCYLDADVRLEPRALESMAAELAQANCELVSGFPRQIAITPLEWLLLPLIHFILMGFLPLPGLRFTANPAFAAGCGQFQMLRKQAYFACGGHSAIRTTMHDGLLLPRLFRSYGYRTGLFDLTHHAVCRMYSNAGEVWRGLAKNATEGLAAPGRIGIFTFLLGCGQVLPVFLVLAALVVSGSSAPATPPFRIALAALALGYATRLAMAILYRQSWRGALLHPIGVLVTLVLQWWSLGRKLAGRPATWKQRAYVPD